MYVCMYECIYIYHIASRAIEKSTNTQGSKRHCFPDTLL